jgi:hypothetical protein
MSIPFLTRAPTDVELRKLRLFLSVFGDGSGQEKDKSGTRAGWRDLERVVSELVGGEALEKKHVFDVLVPSTQSSGMVYGISVKSKCLGTAQKIETLDATGRVYMELTNSPAKLWSPLKAKDIMEDHWGNTGHAQIMGESILETVHQWYAESGISNVDLSRSVHLVASYSKPRGDAERLYQFHSFRLGFPTGIRWAFSSNRCLRGFDPAHPEETLFDWYALSGGQLKYYPRASTAIYSSPVFSLLSPPVLSISERSKSYWPTEWEAIGRKKF